MDPALGRFTTPDPVRDFVNPYSYVRNNPANGIDPTGMTWFNPRGSGLGFGPTANVFWTGIKDYIDDLFTDTDSKMDILGDALMKAQIIAESLEVSSTTTEDQDNWRDIADAIRDIIIEGNFGYDNLNLSGRDITNAQWDPRKLELTVDLDWFNDSETDQIGSLIHEGAHSAHQNRYGLISPKYASIPDEKGGLTGVTIGAGLTRFDSENFAWNSVAIYARYASTQDNFDRNSRANRFLQGINSRGLEREILRRLANYYTQDYLLFGPDGLFDHYRR